MYIPSLSFFLSLFIYIYMCVNRLGNYSSRAFSKESVSRPLLDLCLRAALHNSPSGANCQPWTFVVVETKEMKRQVREIVEAEEKVNYERRMNERWKEDLSPLGTTWEKPYLEDAPALVIVFKQTHGGLLISTYKYMREYIYK